MRQRGGERAAAAFFFLNNFVCFWLGRLCREGFSLVTVWGRLFAAGSLVKEHRLQEVCMGS